MSRLGIFVDVGNLYHATQRKYARKVNFRALYELARFGKVPTQAICYCVGSTNNVKFIQCLRSAGFKDMNIKQPKCFEDGTKKANQDLAIASDICRFMSELDVIVLISADGDFAPILKLCRDNGKYVNVIGCDISFELKEAANQCHEIKEDLLVTN